MGNAKKARERTVGILPGCLLVVVLGFAVFGWGLHSKLSLYHVRANTPAAPIAKLLSERERPNDKAVSGNVNEPNLHAIAAAIVVVSLLSPSSSPSASLLKPRSDEQTPLSHVILCRGPSLLRPPPPVVA